MWTRIDSCLIWPNGKAYLFSGTEYVRYDIAKDKVDPGYPAPIVNGWRGLWTPVGAGVMWPNGKAYFFHDKQYVRYDVKTDRVDRNYPAPIVNGWRDLTLTSVSAAVVWPNNKAYLFGGYSTGASFGQLGYVRYDIAGDRQDKGYPTTVESQWHGLTSPIDAAVVWPNGKAYFFQGTTYVRYDIKKDKVDPGYPAPIANGWPGVPIALPTPATPVH
jgi:hypothetical protein